MLTLAEVGPARQGGFGSSGSDPNFFNKTQPGYIRSRAQYAARRFVLVKVDLPKGTIGRLPKAGSLVAMHAAHTQTHGGRWTYGCLLGPSVSDLDSSRVERISLGPNGLQAPHSTPSPIEVRDDELFSVAAVNTKLGTFILGPEGHTHPHPEAWVLANRGGKVNAKTPGKPGSTPMRAAPPPPPRPSGDLLPGAEVVQAEAGK